MVLIEALLGRFVVIRRNQQRRVGARFLCMPRQGNRFFRGIRAGAGDDRDAPFDGLYRELDDPTMLLIGQRGRLAAGAARDDPIRPIRNLPLNQVAERRLVYFTVPKRRDDRDNGPSESHRNEYSQASGLISPS